MGVQVLSPESTHQKQLRSLPRIPRNSHYSMQPLNGVKHSRALPAVPNSNLAKMETNPKMVKALPRVPKPPSENVKKSNLVHRHVRMLPEVPFKDNHSTVFKDNNTSGSSRNSTPRHSHRDSNVLQTNNNSNGKHTGSNSKNNINNTNVKNSNTHQGNNRILPKLPKMQPKVKPEQNRIEYMHELYKKEGDMQSEEGNYEQALKSYNLALKFISDEKTTIVARSRVYRKLGKPRKAMQDADLALKLDPIYYEGLLQKAELLLEQGDYEGALQHFQKGARMRPDKDDFQDGIEKAKHGMVESKAAEKAPPRKRKNTISPDDTQHKKTKSKSEKAKKNRDNVNVQSQRSNSMVSDDVHNVSYGSSNKESTIIEEAPPLVPVPPSQPAPPMSRARIMNGRQMTPMPGRLKRQMQEAAPKAPVPQEHSEVPPLNEEDINEDMMKQILGSMYKDKSYLEKLLSETDLPQHRSVGPSAENGLHFLYDRVLNWVRKGHAVPAQATTTVPLPRETRTSARRKAMVHGSSVESLLEDQEKENEIRMKRRKKKQQQHTTTKPKSTWYQYLENKKVEEAAERKQSRNIFLHVVEGQQIRPKEHSNLELKKSKHGPDTSRRIRESNLKTTNDSDSRESLNHSFIFKSYRPSSDIRSSKETRKTSPMETSDDMEERIRTPPRKTKRREREKEKIERRRVAVAKFVAKETEEIEYAYSENKYDLCTEKAKHVIHILEQEEWPDKYTAMAFLYSFLGNAAIGKRDYDGGLHFHGKDLEIGEKQRLDESVSRALGNLGRIYVVQKKHQEALDMFLRKTPMCASRIETAWLFHEIGNCFLALGDFEYAKDAAKKSLEAAEEAVEWSYQLQSCVLMGVAEVKLKQYHAAFNTFERALDQARLQGDEKAEDAIREALQDVNDRIVEEMRTKGPLNYPDARSDFLLTPLSRSTTTVTDYQLQGLSRSRAQIMKMEADVGPRYRADYARTPAGQSEYSSIFIPDDDGNVSLADTNDLNIDLERLRTDSTIFGSTLDLRDNIRSETFVSGKRD